MATIETTRSEQREAAKRLLEGYRGFCEMHDRMLVLIEDADSRLTNTTAQMEETVASSGAKDAIGNGLAKLETASNRLKRTDDRICAKLDTTTRLVERTMEIRPKAGRVLNQRYLIPAGEEPTFEEIAKKLGYSVDHVNRLHLEGLDIAAALLENMPRNAD